MQVTNLRTEQQVVVKINDRGPYGGGKRRIIDLSEAAAKRIGLRREGPNGCRWWWSSTRRKAHPACGGPPG